MLVWRVETGQYGAGGGTVGGRCVGGRLMGFLCTLPTGTTDILAVATVAGPADGTLLFCRGVVEVENEGVDVRPCG